MAFPAQEMTSVSTGGARFVSVQQFGSNPGRLQMFQFVPDALPAGAPLVVNLHGCKQDARAYSDGVGWLDLASRCGFALLVPSQTASNNRDHCFNWFDPIKVAEETASIDQMIGWMLVHHPIDPKQVFITGLSAGGATVSNMLALFPHRFAGGAILAGLPFGAATNLFEALDVMENGPRQPRAAWADLVRWASHHDGPWPRISVWHGDADRRVNPANAEAIVQQWLALHGATGTLAIETLVHDARRTAWHAADGKEIVESYSIPNMQHGAPVAGDTRTAPFLIDAGISSTLLIAQFWGLALRAEAPAPAPSFIERTIDSALRALGLRP